MGNTNIKSIEKYKKAVRKHRTEQDTCSMEEKDMEIDHLENTDSNQQENIEIDQENR